jgi:hypothetical protein
MLHFLLAAGRDVFYFEGVPPKLKKVLAKVRKLKYSFQSWSCNPTGKGSNDRDRTEEINYRIHGRTVHCAGTGQGVMKTGTVLLTGEVERKIDGN